MWNWHFKAQSIVGRLASLLLEESLTNQQNPTAARCSYIITKDVTQTGVAEPRYKSELIENTEALLNLVFTFDELGFNNINQQRLLTILVIIDHSLCIS